VHSSAHHLSTVEQALSHSPTSTMQRTPHEILGSSLFDTTPMSLQSMKTSTNRHRTMRSLEMHYWELVIARPILLKSKRQFEVA
jgi:hypothetical protein